ncbi:glycoside hydrolase family 3 C-terminal domain-containing protein [Croceicoccus sp. BE223]|uniref:beta-glucosidase n=1 Tax=Croceicoccus sp. BE223 TaxID=2817716 RepID=UPI00285AF596|nr:glycoside hydrolase family 3 C-terminal domain-containing protein [Croceicoccus sp. BE223]MDR7102289.1 beta-glucosidase [Croceicoccus sp. BE223]
MKFTSVCKPGLGALPAIALAATFAASVSAEGDENAAWDRAERRAEATVRAMTPAEKTILTHGVMAMPPTTTPPDAVPGAGYIPGIPRLGVPALKETDASLGVAYAAGLRNDNATALPSGLAMASTWDADLVETAGRMIGGEARAKGYNVMLAGGVNLMRDPRNGRNFEYFGEDPLLAGTLVGHAIRGVQSNRIIATIKHLALNGQENGRHFADVQISEGNARESDLLAFQIGIEIGQPGSVMCAYNRVNGHQACSSDWLLNRVLKQDWGYKGFVMSDWGAVPDLQAAMNGLDQQSGEQLDTEVFFADKLAAAAANSPAWARRLDDMNKRILTAIYANGLESHPAQPGGAIDYEANAAIAEDAARQGIVLLRNRDNILPLAKSARTILVVGGLASTGVLSGGGSSQVIGEGGPAAAIPLGGTGPFAAFARMNYHRSSPLAAIQAMAPQATVRFRNGRSVAEAAAAAGKADIVIVFANQWSGEGFDHADLTLPEGQDALIAAVAGANPNTVVVLQTGGPVAMPWLDRTAAVIQAWYPGIRGGQAIASVLFGETNPSGRLPITFPAGEAQLPRVKLDGFDRLEPDFIGRKPEGAGPLPVDYDIEGSDIGYRWNARQGHKALFPFGFGLSYTTFETGGLRVDGKTASFTVRNTGNRDGTTVVQVYLTQTPRGRQQRLVGFARVALKAGEVRSLSVPIEPRTIAEFEGGRWQIDKGRHAFALGASAEDLSAEVPVDLAARRWK